MSETSLAAAIGAVAVALAVVAVLQRRFGAPPPAPRFSTLDGLRGYAAWLVFSAAPLVALTFAFAIIACGNSVFGVLEWRAARGLGERGYSIYLLHAVALYVTFGLLLGTERTAALGALGYWSIVYACGITVIVVSFVTFRLIEAPAMASVDRVNRMLGPA